MKMLRTYAHYHWTNLVLFKLCFIITVPLSLAEFVIENKTSNETNFTVTACGKHNSYKIGVFQKRLNWFQAQQFCQDAGYRAIDAADAQWYSKIGIRVFLERTFANFTSETYWQNQFRRDNRCSFWHNYDIGHCDQLLTQDKFAELPQQDEFCSTAVINSSTAIAYVERIKFFPENCLAQYPFICYVGIGPQVYQAYGGFAVDGSPMLTTDNIEVGLQNFSECIRMCNGIANCLAIVYNHNNGFCNIHRPDPWYLHVGLNVTYIGWNITFAHKAGCELSYFSLEETPVINVTESYTFPLPNCNKPTLTLPDGYCPCDNQSYTVEQLDQLVSELVQNLTVPRDTTSSYKQTKTSAEDKRPVARAVGTIGVIATVAFLSMPVISDVWAWNIRRLQRLERRKSRREKKMSINCTMTPSVT